MPVWSDESLRCAALPAPIERLSHALKILEEPAQDPEYQKSALPQNLWVVFAAAERGDWIFGGMAGQMNGGEEEKRPGG